MFYFSFISISWAAIVWFSQPFARPPFGLIFLHVDPLVPLACALIAAAGGILLALARHGAPRADSVRNWWRRNKANAIALVLILCLHAVLEAPYLSLTFGANDGDSAIYGLAGYRIVDSGIRPVFNMSRHHNGSLIPHLTAGLTAIFGKSPVWLRLVNSFFYAGFIIALFILSLMLFDDRRIALIASFLAALPGKELLLIMAYPETPGILFWGTLSLVLLVRITKAERPKPGDYFALGAVIGIGFWTHYQMLFFILTAFIVLLARDWLFFRRPAAWLIPLAFPLGAAPVLVDIFYRGPEAVSVSVTGNFAHPDYLARFAAGIQSFVTNIPVFLGVRSSPFKTVFYETDLFGSAFTVGVCLCFLALVFVFLKEVRFGPRAGRARMNGNALILIFLAVILLLLCLSRFAQEAPMRYILPAWIAIVIIIAAGAVRLAEAHRILPAALTAAFATVFFLSGLMQLIVTDFRESAERQFVETLDGRGIHAFYGFWTRTHWTQYVTADRIVGSALLPLTWHPFPGDYYRVKRAPGNPAILFDYGKERLARHFVKTVLAPLGIRARLERSVMGPLLSGSSQRVTARRIVHVQAGSYAASITGIRIAPAVNGMVPLLFDIENRGSVAWHADAASGHLELAIRSKTGTQLLRTPLSRTVAAGRDFRWPVLLDEHAFRTGLEIAVTLNEYSIILGNRWLRPDEIPVYRAHEIELPQLDRLTDSDAFWYNGWGIVTRNGKIDIRWSGALSSQLAIPSGTAPPRAVRMTLLPFRSNTIPKQDQIIRFDLNGTELAGDVVLRGRKRCRITLPRGLMHPGINILTFHPAYIEPEFAIVGKHPQIRLRPRAFGVERLVLEQDE